MENVLKSLKENHILVCDGAMGSTLMAQGLQAGECPEAWNLKFPDRIRAIHKSYIDVGADIILTNTFGANRKKLKRFNMDSKIKEINRAAIEIAHDARGNSDVYIIADIGPSGDMLKPYGELSEEELYDVYKEQVEILVDSGVDGIILETFSSLEELKVAFDAARFEEDVAVIGSMTFQNTQKGFYTMMGVDVEKAVVGMANAGCNIIGSNCGISAKDMVTLVKKIKLQIDDLNLLDTFIIAQPNAGMPVLEKDKTIFKESPEDFSRHIKDLINAGSNIIGGCCGTTPEHIKAIAKVVKG